MNFRNLNSKKYLSSRPFSMVPRGCHSLAHVKIRPEPRTLDSGQPTIQLLAILGLAPNSQVFRYS